jgi:hypothetical protein
MTSDAKVLEATDSETEDAEQADSELSAIAELLATLSDSEMVPKGWGKRCVTFTKDDVDLSSNAWLVRLAAISPWLHLEDDLSKPTEAAKFMRDLFVLLGKQQPESYFQFEDDVVRLTPVGVRLVTERLETAVKLREQFDEDVEELSPKQATLAWEQRWEEQPLDDDLIEPINAEVRTWTIQQFMLLSGPGKLNLNPTYQRGDVWSTPDSQRLIESIVKGIPLPSIIILKTEAGTSYDIVDGKQRLTAILRFMGQHPGALRIVRKADEEHELNGELVKTFHEDYKRFRTMWKAHRGEKLTATREADLYFPFPLPAKNRLPPGLTAAAGHYYSDAKNLRFSVGGKSTSLADLFEQPDPPYTIPIIIYNNTKPRQIHHVFNLYNKQGKHLNAEEIRNAMFHDVTLARMLLAAAGDNPDIDELAPFISTDLRAAIAQIATSLADYKFGLTRFKRTKVLSWLCSVLFMRALDSSGKFIVRSTAKHIDALFTDIRDRADHPFRKTETLTALVRQLHKTVTAHSSVSWPPEFQDGGEGEKWQEVPLIATLAACFLLSLIQDDPAAVLEEHSEAISAFLLSNKRPEKSQNKDQWRYIGRIGLGIIELCGVEGGTVTAALTKTFGISTLDTLAAAKAL